MRAFITLVKKELLEGIRTGRTLLLAVIFLLFGIMNPAIAKLTPWLYEIMSDALAESGMTVTAVTVSAKDSWVQFFKNIPMALMVFVIINASRFSREYTRGTLIAGYTRGLARYKTVLSKAFVMLMSWTAGYALCFGVTYVYNGFFWDNGTVAGFLPLAINFYAFGVMCVCALVLFSAMSSSSSVALLGTGGVVAASYVLGFLPKLSELVPTALMSTSALMSENVGVNIAALCVSAGASVASLILAVAVINKRNI